jgi:N-acetylglucosaminyl-diphospho-decaprenol L-rhamnosyltransferase
LTVSIVSHGHGPLLAGLLREVAATGGNDVAQVVLTHNLPAPPTPPADWPFALTELFNEEPLGFGANHNRALAHAASDFFCVLNPDITLPDPAIWRALLQAARQSGVGCAYPRLVGPDGRAQQNERDAVTPFALVRRHLLKVPPRRTDWASGAFWVVPAAAWREVGGFDERYYMYCEDTDFCLRLQLAGWRLAAAEATAGHAAAWASRKPGRAMAWHIRSLLRLWTSPVLWRYLARPGPRPGSAEKARQ